MSLIEEHFDRDGNVRESTRVRLFLLTYGGTLLVWGLWKVLVNGPAAILFLIPMSFIYPCGLGIWATAPGGRIYEDALAESTLIGYFCYALVFALMLSLRRPGATFMLWIVLVLLTVTNIGGCVSVQARYILGAP